MFIIILNGGMMQLPLADNLNLGFIDYISFIDTLSYKNIGKKEQGKLYLNLLNVVVIITL